MDLRIDDQSIKEAPTTKFLGVYIDNKLNWKTHISYLSKTGISYQGAIVWNKILCADINPDSSELSSKMMLKNILSSNY